MPAVAVLIAAAFGAGPATAPVPGSASIEKVAEKLPGSGQRCEAKQALTWKPATVKNVDGDLYLVVWDGREKQLFWAWVSSDCVRPVGSDKPGPKWADKVGVGNKTVPAAKAEAKAKLAEWKAKYAAENKKADAEDDTKAGNKADTGVATDATGDRAEAARAAAEAKNGKPAGPFDPLPFDKPIAAVQAAGVKPQTVTTVATASFDPDRAASPANTRPIRFGDDARGRLKRLVSSNAAVMAVYEERKNLYQVRLATLGGTAPGAAIDFDPLSRPFAVSDDGKLVIGRSDNLFAGTKLRLDVYDVTAAALGHRVSFEPYKDASVKSDRDITFAAGLGGRVLTCNAAGDLTAWDVGDGKSPPATVRSVWRTQLPKNTTVAAGPGGKTVVAVAKDAVTVLDAATGSTRQYVVGGRRVTDLAVTPDGRTLVGLDGPSVVSWDLVAAKARPDVGLPAGFSARSTVTAVSANYLLLGDGYLFDLPHNAIMWQYVSAGDTFFAAGRTWGRVDDGKSFTLVPATLPDAAARNVAVNTADSLLRRGDKVSLEIAVEADAAKQAAIRTYFEKQLARDGLVVADGQPTKLVVRTENGGTTMQSWSRPGGAPWNREQADVAVTDKISVVRWERDGKIAWQNLISVRPGMSVSAQQGQSVSDAVQAANTFNTGFFETVVLPTVVPRPGDKPSYGVSRWTADGVVAGK